MCQWRRVCGRDESLAGAVMQAWRQQSSLRSRLALVLVLVLVLTGPRCMSFNCQHLPQLW